MRVSHSPLNLGIFCSFNTNQTIGLLNESQPELMRYSCATVSISCVALVKVLVHKAKQHMELNAWTNEAVVRDCSMFIEFT